VSKRYPYPRDEFDNADAASRPKEVHAARRTTWSKVWPFIVVIVVVPVMAFGVVKFIASWNDPANNEPLDTEAAPTVTQTLTDTATAPGPEVTPGEDDPTEPAATEVANTLKPPDRTLPVVILNAKGESGLAAKAQTLLRTDSWADVSVADYRGEATDGLSTVYYAKKAQLSSARVIAGILQVDTIKKDKRQTNGGAITVILRQDYIVPTVID